MNKLTRVSKEAASQHRVVHLSLLLVSLLTLNFVSLPGLVAAANLPGTPTPPQTLTQTFSEPASVITSGRYTNLLNIRYDDGLGLGLAGQGFQPPRWSGDWADFGLFSALPQTFPEAFNTLQASWQAETPAGTHLEVDLRVSPDNQNWSLWQTLDTSGQKADFGANNAFLYAQYRVRLFGASLGQSPTFNNIRLEANRRDLNNLSTARYFSLANIAQPAPVLAQPPTYRVYATREGLVGGRTANGHIIQPHDHFVSLPSWTALSDLGKSDYKVRITTPAGLSAVAPVWDTGPWNFHDNYWHNPRHEFTDLPVGVPQAEKAYFDKHNRGLNENGVGVYNPSGIDIADGTYWDDLNLDGASAGKLDVTFLWEGSLPGAPVIEGVQAYGAWQNGVQVKWTTGTPANSWVEYGPTDRYGQSTWVYEPLGTNHNRVLTDLIPGQTYNFRVHNKDIYGSEVVSPNFSFQTTPGTTVKLATFQNDPGIGLTTGKDNTSLVLLGARVNPSFWNDNPKADFLAGGRVEAGLLANAGNLDLDFAPVCDAKGANCTMGYGSGYKNFVRFANAKGETLEIGLIHDAGGLSPNSLTLMLEGNYTGGAKLRRYNPPDSTDQKIVHHFHFSWQNNQLIAMFDNQSVGDPFNFNTDGLSISFIGAGRAKDDTVAASYQNIAFSAEALLPPKP